MSQTLGGVPGAPGIAIGPLFGLARVASSEATPTLSVPEAQARVASHLEQLAVELRDAGKPDEAAIFDAQALLAIDPALIADLEPDLPLARAVTRAAERVAGSLAALDDPYLRQRAADVSAVGQQISAMLSGSSHEVVAPADSVVVADDVTPTELMALHKCHIAGMVLVGGTPTGHVAILARALQLPLLLSLSVTSTDALAILDASAGTLVIDPLPDEIDNARTRLLALRERSTALVHVPATTRDGQPVQLWANIGSPDEAQLAVDLGAEGVGLFRTEFLFLERATAPSEEEQYAAYCQTLSAMAGRPVVVRTVDVGGDKPMPYLPPLVEPNPFLGQRGIRFSRRFPELFETQVRALLRAAAHGELRIMLPMVAVPADVAWAFQLLQRVADGTRIPPLGIMIETPAAAVALDRLAAAAPLSFCSLGTNDLAQYTLAADRSDASLAADYRFDEPAVFRLIRTAAASAHALELSISVCGELAGSPQHALALVGLGISTLSMAPTALAAVKAALLEVSLPEAKSAAERACQ